MAEFILICRGSHEPWDKFTEKDWNQLNDLFGEWVGKLKALGKYKKGTSLPADFKSVKKNEKNTFVVDGPFSETKEALTGFFLIESNDQAEAVEFAKGCPSLLYDRIEVYQLN
jgi:hypothetical protein